MTASGPLNVALIGCGAVSKLYYTPALQKLESQKQLQVSALFDPNPANAAQVHRAFPAAGVVKNFDDLLQQDLDLAIVASPPQYHAVQTIQFLRSGTHVLCEKPMALSAKEGESMASAASAAGRLLAIGLFRRFFPVTRTIHHILSQNILGNVKSFTCYEGRIFRWPVQSASYFKENGVLRDIGAHVLDLLTWWWGEPEEILYEDDAMGGVDLNCRIHLKFPQGFSGDVILSREFRLPNTYSIQCESGQIRWDIDETSRIQTEFTNTCYYLDSELHKMSGRDRDLIVPGPVAEDFHECFVNQLKNVIGAIHGGDVLAIPAEEGLRSLRMIEECYSQRKLMDMPWLSEQEVTRARQFKEGQPT